MLVTLPKTVYEGQLKKKKKKKLYKQKTKQKTVLNSKNINLDEYKTFIPEDQVVQQTFDQHKNDLNMQSQYLLNEQQNVLFLMQKIEFKKINLIKYFFLKEFLLHKNFFKIILSSTLTQLYSLENNNYSLLPNENFFSPIEKVNFIVEKDDYLKACYEHIILEIWTNGSLSPKNTLFITLAILKNFLTIFQDLNAVVSFTALQKSNLLNIYKLYFIKPVIQSRLATSFHRSLLPSFETLFFKFQFNWNHFAFL
eukprot:TRINITY_DN457_c0_g1_i17.p1 TRINITY_DN457_c0_g1~~TRINITY_DN457_c0_g1_i17.p1  ORF type:complete len:253 (-),score=5.14 TRINITY_DN457_c0_g1_i17:599-1357(-)